MDLSDYSKKVIFLFFYIYEMRGKSNWNMFYRRKEKKLVYRL